MCKTVKTNVMKCGHSCNFTRANGAPICVICFGSTKDAEIVLDEKDLPDLSDRKAYCSLCNEERDSDWSLIYFKYNGYPEKEFCKTCKTVSELHFMSSCREFVSSGLFLKDSYYCGCQGWD